MNLCGASIGEGRWTQARKIEIRDSRVLPTRCLVDAMSGLGHVPKLIQASAVGFYGPGDTAVDESHPAGHDYLSKLAVEWEGAAADYSGPTVLARFGVVLDDEGGALPKMALPFKLFVGGKLGKGEQWLSWISLADATRAIMHAITTSIIGPVNIVAPNPVINADFASALGRALRRPALFPTPGIVLQTLLGEQSTVLLEGQRVLPTKLLGSGFSHQHPDVQSALNTILNP